MTIDQLKDTRDQLMRLWERRPTKETMLRIESITRRISAILEGRDEDGKDF